MTKGRLLNLLWRDGDPDNRDHLPWLRREGALTPLGRVVAWVGVLIVCVSVAVGMTLLERMLPGVKQDIFAWAVIILLVNIWAAIARRGGGA